jgi:hypothetical protein
MAGTLSAPGGALAFNAPRGLQRFFAEFFGRNAVAALPGTQPVYNATVKLIEINSAGAQVGADIATTVTALDGSFTLNAPAGFVPSPRYVIRASGSTTNLDRMVTDTSDQEVDPASQVTRDLVIAQLLASGANIQGLLPRQLEQISHRIAALIFEVDAASMTSTAALIAALTQSARANVETTSSLGNLTASGGIAGGVIDTSSANLFNITIVARDFNAGVLRAQTTTDANGQYSLNLAPGDYLVAALNFTAASMAASEYWTCNDVAGGPACGTVNRFNAARVTVGASATTVNFKLEAGARIEGTAIASGTTIPLPGIQMFLRDFVTGGNPEFFAQVHDDGSFRINVRPNFTFTVAARNSTRQPYATGHYNGPAAGGTTNGGGGASTGVATPVTLVAGTTTTINFELIEGGVLQGHVKDGATPTPNPVEGVAVRFFANFAGAPGLIEAILTDMTGGYRLWVKPQAYTVRSRGQTATPTVVANSSNPSPASVDFLSAVGRATATFHTPASAPLGQVSVTVYDGTPSAVLQGFEFSLGDGSVEVYAGPTGNYRIEAKVNNGSTKVGSGIYNNKTQLLLGDPVFFDTTAANPTALGTITLPVGAELKGTVTVGGTPIGNGVVQVRSGGTAGTNRFVSANTHIDGTYTISLPAGTYDRVCAFVFGTAGAICPTAASSPGTFASADNVTVTADQSTTLNIAIP